MLCAGNQRSSLAYSFRAFVRRAARVVWPDTTTIALIARAAKRGARVCVWLATSCFPPHKAAFLPER
jgi:hypothetical protein